MNATQQLLERWWKARKPATVKAAGDALGIGSTAIANYRAGLSQAKPAVIAKMAADLGEDPGHWLAQVEAERAGNDRDRKAWQTLARRLGAAATVACVVVAPFLFGIDHADSAALMPALLMHYAKWAGLAVALIATVLWWRRGHSAPPVLA